MPCMNSTFACDLGGSVPFVDGGSVLLGLPGAPGCTTTGFAGSVCCAQITEEKSPLEQKKTAHTLAASCVPLRIFRRYRSTRVECRVSVNPTLGCIYNAEPSRK